MRIAFAVLAVLIDLGPVLARDCPLDRITFIDKKTRAQFIAQRVAVDYSYLCPNDTSRTVKRYSRPQKGLSERCQGPYGDTIVAGTLAGREVVAIYTVIKGVPCCSWETYEANDSKFREKRLTWLSGADVPAIELESEWYTIGSDNSPGAQDKGPLGGGEYVPRLCRAAQ